METGKSIYILLFSYCRIFGCSFDSSLQKLDALICMYHLEKVHRLFFQGAHEENSSLWLGVVLELCWFHFFILSAFPLSPVHIRRSFLVLEQQFWGRWMGLELMSWVQVTNLVNLDILLPSTFKVLQSSTSADLFIFKNQMDCAFILHVLV